jgi:vitamin B12 transporter
MTTHPRFATLAIGGVLLSAAPPLGAQDARDTVRLREIVVTATRLPAPLASTTASVTVITGADLRARGVATAADALRTVPGTAVVETGPRGGVTSLFLRGGESNMVRVLVDGVPLNAPGGSVDLANLTTDDVERIEIVRGPASVLYGSDAVAGVVQIFTRAGRGPRWEAGVGGGTFGSRRLDLRLGTGTAPAEASLALSHQTTDGIYPFNNAYRNDVVAAEAGFAPDQVASARLTARYTNALYHYPTDGSGALRYQNQYQSGSGVVASLDAGRFVAPALETRLLLALAENTGRQDQEPNGPADTLGFYAFWSLDRLSRRSADARLNWYAAPATVLTAGAALETEAERSSNASRSQYGPSAGALVVSRWNRAYYAQAVADAGAHVSFTTGLRLEDNEAFGTFLTYRAGVTWRGGGATRLRAAVGTAFKEPGFLDTYGTGYVTGNPNLKPERSRSWDAGIEQRLLGGRLLLSATWFDQRFRDLIQYTFAPPTPTSPNYYNVAAANASGLELEARAGAAALEATARYTYTRTASADSGFDGATFAEGQRLLRRPTDAASLDLAYRFSGRGSASVTAQYVGDRDDEDFSTFPGTRVRLPAYLRLDLAGQWLVLGGPGSRTVAATLKVENLLDARYEQVLHFPSRRRALFVGVRLQGGF